MADLADITDTHDFNEEAVRRHLTSVLPDRNPLKRGKCLNCDADINELKSLYCDPDCREDFESAARISKLTRRSH